MGLILVYGGGSVFLCWELITDGKFAETGDVDDRIPLYIRFGIPTLLIGFGLFPWDVPPALAIVNIGIWPIIMGLTMFLQQKLNPQ